MGWASGSYLAQDLWTEIRNDIKLEKRERVARKIISSFCNRDADDWDLDHLLFKDAGVFHQVDEEDCGECFDKDGNIMNPFGRDFE